MNVVDSSAWLEYFANTNRARFFAKAIEDIKRLIVPTISLYEVYKKVCRERGQNAALHIYSTMMLGQVVDLSPSLALSATRHPLPLADSVIYETALHYQATLWTQDEHFAGLNGVRFFPKE
jgi:toxin FitB